MQAFKTISLLVLCIVLSTIYHQVSQDPPEISQSEQMFSEWKQQFSKHYQNQIEENYRYKIFKQNFLLVKSHNAKHQTQEETFKLKLNQFSDLTNEQINSMYFDKKIDPVIQTICTGPQYPAKDSFDANFTLDTKLINPVVGQQGQCASGYAFATIGAAESTIYRILKQQTFSLSAQQIVDCSVQTGNSGCNSGNAENSLSYMIKRGAMREEDYPYVGKTQGCTYNSSRRVWDFESCTKVDSNLTLLKSAVFNQPVIVSFDATDPKFIQYSQGIYQAPTDCGSKINHYMLAVGWGQVVLGTLIKKTYYYIVVKNSFGIKWGEKGYGRIVIQADKVPSTACGLLNEIYFPNH